MEIPVYKRLTCPMSNCPNDNEAINFNHYDYDIDQVHEAAWGLTGDSTALNCRMLIKADITLNGKLIIDIEQTSGQSLMVFIQPNGFTKEGVHGMLENGLIQNDLTSGTISIPSDFYFLISFRIDREKQVAGSPRKIVIKSRVERYTEAD